MLAEELQLIKDGNHPVMLQRKRELFKEMDKKIIMADKYRKTQIRNINELYDFEIQDIKAQFEVLSVPST